MPMQVRRVVAGHDASGKSIISSDEVLTAVSRGAGANITGCEIWSTDQMPVDNSREAESSQKAGFVKHEPKHNNYVRTGGGTLIRIIEWGPDHPRFTHRTETVDYTVILSGEIDLEMEGSEVVHLQPGDTVVQRGSIHTWMNRGTTPAVMASVLIDALPVEVDGKTLHTQYPDD
jgi:uncharacterized cupin superfamily protein